MCWLKRDIWKTGIAFAGMLLLLVWVPMSAAGAYEGTWGLATPGTATVQATPSEDATVTALNKEKLTQEVKQLKNQNYWAWTTIGPILVGFAGLLAALYSLITWIRNRQDEQKKRDDDRLQNTIAGLGSERIEARAIAASMLLTFLEQPGYERFHQQIFNLAVTNLRLRHVDPSTPEPLDSLSQALITVFKESFPLAREMLKKRDGQFNRQSLVARSIQLDNAFLSGADLKQLWMPQASLRKAILWKAKLNGADLRGANLSGANLSGVELDRADLRDVKLDRADLRGAKLSGSLMGKADLTEADLTEADLTEADLTEATLSRVNLEGAFLKGTDLRGVTGLDDKQKEACKAKGAIIDEDSTTSPPQLPVSPPPSQSSDIQAPSAPPAQVNTPPPETDGSSAASTKPDLES